MERVMAVATLRMQINVHLETVKMASFMLDVFFKKKKKRRLGVRDTFLKIRRGVRSTYDTVNIYHWCS